MGQEIIPVTSYGFHGRAPLLTTYRDIDSENVLEALAEIETDKMANLQQIEYLFKYVKGEQPILNRTKKTRKDINNKVIVNMALEIRDFRTSYFLGEPCQFVSRTDNSSKVNALNKAFQTKGKDAIDLQIASDVFTCGVGFRMLQPAFGEEVPFSFYRLDPRQTYVIRWNGYTKEPVMAVWEYIANPGDVTPSKIVYTKQNTIYINSVGTIVSVEPHAFAGIPIVEYRFNDERMSSFEPVMSMLETVNLLESNRTDSIEQFVQAYLKFKNCEVTEASFATFLEKGAIMIPPAANGQDSDVDLVSRELNQGYVQTAIDDLKAQIRSIVGLPSQSDGNTSDSSNNGASVVKNGWEKAETLAKMAQAFFIQSEFEFLDILLKLLKRGGDRTIGGLKMSDVAMAFNRRNYTDIQSKSQVLTTMLESNKIDPRDAYTACGLFTDPNAAYARGMAYYKSVQESETQPEPTEETNNIMR